jgi:hypothetical protein
MDPAPSQAEINVQILQKLQELLDANEKLRLEKEKQQEQIDALLAIDATRKKLFDESVMRAEGDFAKLKEKYASTSKPPAPIPETPLQQRNFRVMEEAERIAKERAGALTTSSSSTTAPTPVKSSAKQPKKHELGPSLKQLARSADCEEWFRRFDLLIEPYSADEGSKIATLHSLLPEDTIQWLATLPLVNRVTYEALKVTIQKEYRVKTHAGITDLQRFIDTVQLDDQPVSSYAAILEERANRLAEGGQPVAELIKQSTFVNGLKGEIQVKVRQQATDLDDLQALKRLATKAESDLLDLAESLRRRAELQARVENQRAPNNSNSNQTNSNSAQHRSRTNNGNSSRSMNNNNGHVTTNARACRDCGTVTASAEHDRCQPCHLAAKNRGEAMCSRCRTSTVVPGKGWCRACYDNSSQRATNTPQQQSPSSTQQQQSKSSSSRTATPTLTNPSDYVLQQVPGRAPNNASTNPLDWKTARLKENSLCPFCAKSISDGHDCSKKYPHYMPDEVRTLLIANKTPAPRTMFPTGIRPWKGPT